MTTLRKELTRIAGVNWTNLIIAWQPISPDAYCPGWSEKDELLVCETIDQANPIMDLEFDDGYGAPHMPRFIAWDANWIYFPSQYDGSTKICRIRRNPRDYVGSSEPTPYPGG